MSSAPEFPFPLPPVSRGTDPATSREGERGLEPRRVPQLQRILARLRTGPATNAELAGISLKYTGRISDLRSQGYVIACTRQAGCGVSTYELLLPDPCV